MSFDNLLNQDILEAIILKFGSVENLAEILNTSRQNIYNKINRKSTKFISELIRLGVTLPNKSSIKIGSDVLVGKMRDNAKNEVIHNYGNSNEFDALRQENELLKKKLELAEKEIDLLNREIELLKK